MESYLLMCMGCAWDVYIRKRTVCAETCFCKGSIHQLNKQNTDHYYEEKDNIEREVKKHGNSNEKCRLLSSVYVLSLLVQDEWLSSVNSTFAHHFISSVLKVLSALKCICLHLNLLSPSFVQHLAFRQLYMLISCSVIPIHS